MKNLQIIIFLSFFIFSCSDSDEIATLENESPQEKELKAFLNNPVGFSDKLKHDFAILKFEQSYFEDDPFLTLTTRVKNSNKLNKQKVLGESLTEGRNGYSFLKIPRTDLTRFKNDMSFDIDKEKVDFPSIEPIRMAENNRIKSLKEGQLINWNSSYTKSEKVLILIKHNLHQLIEDGKSKVGDKHPYTKILVDDTGSYRLTKKDLSIFETGSTLEFVLIRGDYYPKEFGKSNMYVGTVSLYHSNSFTKN